MRGGVAPPLFLVCTLGYGLEECCVPARARGAEDGGGAAGPSTVKGEMEMLYQKFKNLTVFPCRRTLGRAMRRKARRLALADRKSVV